MFKKIFHSSGMNKIGENLKSSTLSDSSDSGESELVNVEELTKPERRYFLRRASKLKPGSGDNLSNFRTFDPFDIKSSLRRSNSFPFKSSPELSDGESAKIPRSKSVHFAEDLATYHEFKPSISSSLSDMESAFEEFCRMKQIEAASESKKNSPDESEYAGEADFEEIDARDHESGSETDTPKDIEECSEAEKASFNIDENLTKEMKSAGQHLQSVFSDIVPKPIVMDITRAVGFDTSDSTDVESDSDPRTGSEWEFIYLIYEQLCGLQQMKANDMSGSDIQMLKGEVMSMLADIGDKCTENENQIKRYEKEAANFEHVLQKNSQELESQSSIISSLQIDLASYEGGVAMMGEMNDQICCLKTQIRHLEEEKNIQDTSIKAMTDLEAKLEESQKEVSALKWQTKEIEQLRISDQISRHEKNELLANLNSVKKESEGLQQFQEVERTVLQKELEKAQAQAQSFANQVQEKTLTIDNIKSTYTAHKASKDHQLMEAKLMIQELGKRYEEKRSQVSTLVGNLEKILTQPRSKIPVSSSSGELRRRTPSSDSKVSSTISDMDLASMLLTKLQKSLSDHSQQDYSRNQQLEKVSRSNQIAVEVLKSLIKGSFEALAPIFDNDCAEQFTQLYYNFSQSDIVTEDTRAVILVLSTFIFNSQRELLRSHQKNEQMLETEIQDRLKYQQQVLDSFTRIVRQVMDNNRAPRISGIRGHSSPKKHRPAPRH